MMTAAFHLSNKEAQHELNVLTALEFYHFVFLILNFIILIFLEFHLFCEKLLTFRHHLVEQKTILARQTAAATCRLKLGCWSLRIAKTLRTAALSMVYLTAEYWAPIWCHSDFYCFIDSVLYDALRSVTGCLDPTPIDHQPILSGIQPAKLRRLGATLCWTNNTTLDPDRMLSS